MIHRFSGLGVGILALLPFMASAQEPDIVKERATLLRTALKAYGAFVKADLAKGEVVLRMESDSQERIWSIDPDAEVRVHGLWGALEDFTGGDRVWIWVRLDREKKPRAIFMICDEISEQDIHQVPYALSSVDLEKREIAVRRTLDGKTEESRSLKIPASFEVGLDGGVHVFRSSSSAVRVKAGDPVYLQSARGEVLRIAGADELAGLKEAQKARLDARFRQKGLPGTISFIHGPTGEVEVVIDHAAMRWARHVKSGDAVRINVEPPIRALALEVRPHNERTRLSLAAVGRELGDLHPGQRIRVGVPEPSAEVLKSHLPSDAGRPREAASRSDWILASTYCNCRIAGDSCTGMFYTLASCNAMTCGMPKRVRTFIAPLIEKGQSDREILDQMEKELGPGIWKPHLLR